MKTITFKCDWKNCGKTHEVCADFRLSNEESVVYAGQRLPAVPRGWTMLEWRTPPLSRDEAPVGRHRHLLCPDHRGACADFLGQMGEGEEL